MKLKLPDLVFGIGLTVAASIQFTSCEALGSAPTNKGSALMILAGMTPDWGDRSESKEERIERLRPIAYAIEKASSSAHDTAALLAILNHESMAAKRIQFDQCRTGECGGGAIGLFQIESSACHDKFHHLPPTPARWQREAECALTVFWEAKKRCKGKNASPITDGMSGYRGVCQTTDGALRTNTFHTMANVLANGWPRPPKGWQRDPKPKREDRVYALERMKELDAEAGDFFRLPTGAGVLVEWHFHDFGGPVSPHGWHKGLSLYFYD